MNKGETRKEYKKSKKILKTITIDKDLNENLKEYCKINDLYASSLIEYLIFTYMKDHYQPDPELAPAPITDDKNINNIEKITL